MTKRTPLHAITEIEVELPGYISEPTLAKRIGLTNTKSMWRYRQSGKGPVATKIGRRIYYSDADVAAWLERCRQPEPGLSVIRKRRRGSANLPQRVRRSA